MTQKLFVRNDKKTTDLITRLHFSQNTQGRYNLDEPLMDHLDVTDDCPEGFRPVAIHIVPYTVVQGEIIHYAFNSVAAPTIYVSFQIDVNDFVAHTKDDYLMSPCQTIVGKIVRTFDQPHINITLDLKQFKFPAVVQGEFVWAMEVQGDDHQTVDELVAQLGSVVGRVTKGQIANEDIAVNELSKAIVAYKTPSDDIEP